MEWIIWLRHWCLDGHMALFGIRLFAVISGLGGIVFQIMFFKFILDISFEGMFGIV